jgi:hypothetical protein
MDSFCNLGFSPGLGWSLRFGGATGLKGNQTKADFFLRLGLRLARGLGLDRRCDQ